MLVDFETGRGHVRINPSCNANMTKCWDALPISVTDLKRQDFMFDTHKALAIERAFRPRNLLDIDVSSLGDLTVRFNFVNSQPRVRRAAPAISGEITLAATEPDARVRLALKRDNYPSLEIYQDGLSLYRGPAGSIRDLAGIPIISRRDIFSNIPPRPTPESQWPWWWPLPIFA